MNSPIIGVLALQGAFAKHREMLHTLSIPTKEVRTPQDLQDCDGLIIPGGESTTISKQIDSIHLHESILEFAKKKPLFGTCAGLILMASEIDKGEINPLRLLDISVQRNAYGRQIESFETEVEIFLGKSKQTFSAIFIRAPLIKSYGAQVEVLSSFNNTPILVQQGHHLAATFHPELSQHTAIHRYFFKLVKDSVAAKN
ncbi:pyridoxal 5'-phosphate synthase glutaminase subunit PdxT [Parachlamydia sp. AcF125]|uniref:pyridoxal 5'-phosphate synthase glutaminase subunit PdxT n=1 Tax=Parachlamydia sp. AcF125 TaxID=2795736 RepID=UPI001BC928F1|nr:pyridoxal 5'-phosphate synthase glutaminase subunit PdxT [Parachlamydia sp. AcF125]MBS4167761.1 Pyridoxal 5'-phosphate synthase subunit PdxT [Parachlamydia sp. AcF125]